MMAAPLPAATHVVATYSLKLRAVPRIPSLIRQYLRAGEPLTVLDHQGPWARVRAAGGVEGYVAAKYLRPLAP